MSEGVRYHTGKFPPKELDLERLFPLIGPANGEIRYYAALSKALPNPDLLLSPLRLKEATLSCAIEGTTVTLGEMLSYEGGSINLENNPEKKRDAQEVINYREALRVSIDLMSDDQERPLPICGTVLKKAHEVLLADARGTDKARGKYRRMQNLIGVDGCTEANARFVPIAPDELENGMARWEEYVNDDQQPDPLIQLAIIHAEFESLHPFLDGNGRLGRMLIPLFLYARKILPTPTFYLSEYIEENRQEYVDRLREISRSDDWTGWCEFFLKALAAQGERNAAKADGICDLYKEKKEWVQKEISVIKFTPGLDFIFEQVNFTATSFIEKTGYAAATGGRFLRECEDKGLLRCTKAAEGRSPASYSFKELRELIG